MAYELIRVSELAELSTPADVNVLPIQAGDTLKKITFANLKGAAVGGMEGSLAADYDSTATYAVGDYCIYEGQLYRCTTAITTAEAWTSGHWTAAVLTDDIASDLSTEASTRSTNDNALAADIAEALGDLAAVYSTSATYAVGDYCIYQGQLYRCTTAITTAEAWTSGHWTAVALGGDISTLRSALNTYFEADGVEYIATDLSQPNVLNTETVTGAYAEIVNTSPKRLRLTENSIYTSFIFTTTENISVYFDDETIAATGYVAIATLTNPSSLIEDPNGDYYVSTTGNDPVRYRKQDNNLPSSNNPLSISEGVLVIVSIQNHITIPKATILYTPVKQAYLSTNVKLHAEQVEPFIPEPVEVVSKYRVKKTATSFEIKNRNAKYYVNYYNNPSIRANVWRTNRCDIKLKDGTYFTLWNNSDSDGVVQLGEDDFIGGYHGDEIQTLTHMYVDGVEVFASDTFDEKDYESIVMMFTSNVYHCNTSEAADRVAFVRNKVLIFDENGFTVKNYWVAQESLSYILAYMGMLSIERYLSDGTTPLISGYYTNEDYVYKNNATATSRSEKITDVHFVTPYGDASVSMKFPASMQNNRGHVQDYNTSSQQRLKAYLGFGYGTAIPLASGESIQAESTIKI